MGRLQDDLGAERKQAATQVIALKACFEGETLTIVNNLGIPEADRNKQDEIIKKLQQHVEGKINFRSKRHKFNTRMQLQGETIADYVVMLRDLASSCRFRDNEMVEDLIVDRMVVGVQDQDIVERLLETKDLTLGRALEIAESIEQAKTDKTSIRGGAASINVQKSRQSKQPSRADDEEPCEKCGYTHGKRGCPAQGKDCKKCGRKNHFAKVCKGRQTDGGSTNVIRSFVGNITSRIKNEPDKSETDDDYD